MRLIWGFNPHSFAIQLGRQPSCNHWRSHFSLSYRGYKNSHLGHRLALVLTAPSPIFTLELQFIVSRVEGRTQVCHRQENWHGNLRVLSYKQPTKPKSFFLSYFESLPEDMYPTFSSSPLLYVKTLPRTTYCRHMEFTQVIQASWASGF